MTRKIIFTWSLFMCLTLTYAQSDVEKGLAAINKDVLRGQLDFLASDWMEGRGTAERGAYMAADYIASMFRVYGLKPGGAEEWIYPSRAERMNGKKPYQEKTFFQNLALVEYTEGEEQVLSIIEKSKTGEQAYHLGYETDFKVSVSSHGIECSAPVVFVGYGLVDEEKGYNDFKGIDIEGKVIVRLAGVPGHNDENSPGYKKYYPKERYGMWYLRNGKNEYAQKNGALAVIEVSPDKDNALYWADNVPFHYQRGHYEGPKPNEPYYRLRAPGKQFGSRVTEISLSQRAVAKLLEGTGIDLEAYEKKAARLEKQKPVQINKTLHLKTTVKSRIVKCRNVVGLIEGKKKDEYIVVGAHYDHLGMKNGYIYNGADDNGSGTVGILTIAKAILATGVKPEKSILFTAWTGEEKGIIGSRYYAENPTVPLEKIKYYANFDMISRNVNDSAGVKCNYTYTKAFESLRTISEENIQHYHLNLELNYRAQEKPRGGSDHMAFANKNIPVTCMITGLHEEYHTPEDEVEKVSYDKMYEVVKLGFLNIWRLANEPELLRKN